METLLVAIVVGLALIIFIIFRTSSPNRSMVKPSTSKKKEEFEVNLNFNPSSTELGHYLVIDVETTGIPTRRSESPTNFDNFPRIVQIAWILLDKQGGIIDQYDTVIKQSAPIPPLAVGVHGITTERANSEGIDISEALTNLSAILDKTKFLVAHNIEFDKSIIESEYYRNGIDNPLGDVRTICTMKRSTEYCNYRIGTGRKWPKLSELYKACYMPDYPHPLNINDGHNALVDVFVTGKCLLQLKEHGVIRQ